LDRFWRDAKTRKLFARLMVLANRCPDGKERFRVAWDAAPSFQLHKMPNVRIQRTAKSAAF
jgi:hypothetical protein